MKKLITICLLVATTFTVNAQQKPSKEETIAFIKRTCESTIGKTADTKTFIRTSFNYDNFNTEYHLEVNEKNENSVDKFSLIKWENVTDIWMIEFKPGFEQEISQVMITFSSKILMKQDEQAGVYRDTAYFYYPTTKKESVKKAIERLVEIAKEENKDPFQN